MILFAFLNMAFAPFARADYWGANFDAANYQITVEQTLKKIEDTLVANLKIIATRLIQQKIQSLLSGGGASGGQSLIISDWRQFIYGSAQQYSMQITNNFFQGVNAGATSAIRQYVTGPAQMAVNTDYWGMRPDLQNYCPGGDPTKAFSAGTSNQWKCWQMSGAPQNDLAFTTLRGASFKQAAYDQEAEKKKAEGIAGQGYKGVEQSQNTTPATASNGRQVTVPSGSDYKGESPISTPGSTVKSTAEAGLQSPLQILENAHSFPEVITSIAMQMITQVIQQGLNQVGNKLGIGSLGINAGQIQQLIQSGARTAPNSSALPASSLPSGWNRGGQD